MECNNARVLLVESCPTCTCLSAAASKSFTVQLCHGLGSYPQGLAGLAPSCIQGTERTQRMSRHHRRLLQEVADVLCSAQYSIDPDQQFDPHPADTTHAQAPHLPGQCRRQRQPQQALAGSYRHPYTARSAQSQVTAVHHLIIDVRLARMPCAV